MENNNKELNGIKMMIADGIVTQEAAEKYFPELKESEDERIRGAIIDHLKDYNLTEWLAWLEKQGEQKPVPKFKVGDTMRTLQEATNGYTDGMPVVVSIDKEYYHCTNELIAIKDQDDYEFPPINVKQNLTDKVEPKFKAGDKIIGIVSGIQYYISKVCNDYYFTETGACIMFNAQNNFKLYEQKPTEWSEDDESIALGIEQIVDCASLLNIAPDKLYKIRNWLKSLKDRVGCEANCTTAKQRSEDEESIINKAESWLDTLCDYLKDSSPEYISDIKDVINRLKSLKDRIGG